MKFDKLLEFQNLDISLKRIMQDLEKSADAQKIEKAKQEFAIAKKAVEDSEKDALALVEFFSCLENEYQDIQKKIDKVVLQIDKLEKQLEKQPEKIEELEKFISELSLLKGATNSIESKTHENKSKGDETIQKYKAASERAKKIREVHAKAKERQDALLKEKELEIKIINDGIKKLEPLIDKELMTQYKTLAGEGKYPAFVAAHVDGKNFSCKGCGMSLSQTGSSALNSKGYTNCESCRRVVYKG